MPSQVVAAGNLGATRHGRWLTSPTVQRWLPSAWSDGTREMMLYPEMSHRRRRIRVVVEDTDEPVAARPQVGVDELNSRHASAAIESRSAAQAGERTRVPLSELTRRRRRYLSRGAAQVFPKIVDSARYRDFRRRPREGATENPSSSPRRLPSTCPPAATVPSWRSG